MLTNINNARVISKNISKIKKFFVVPIAFFKVKFVG